MEAAHKQAESTRGKYSAVGREPRGVRATLENAGICNLLGEENICPDIHAALERARVLAAQSGTGK